MPPPAVQETAPRSPLGIIAFGSSDPAIEEARVRLREDAAIELDYLRLRALPLAPTVLDFITRRRRVVVLDQNRDGQMLQLLRAEYGDRIPEGVLRSLRHYSGHPMDARTIVDHVTEMEIGA